MIFCLKKKGLSIKDSSYSWDEDWIPSFLFLHYYTPFLPMHGILFINHHPPSIAPPSTSKQLHLFGTLYRWMRMIPSNSRFIQLLLQGRKFKCNMEFCALLR